MNKYDEEVFDCYTDTAGNYHWTGTRTGHHVISKADMMGRNIDTGHKICGECKWHTYEPIDRGYVCTNANSDYCTEWTSEKHGCANWEFGENWSRA